MIAAPSIARDYRIVFSGDPALDAPVRADTPERMAGESEEEWQARGKAWDDTWAAWEQRLRVARETGDWAPLLKPGQVPTCFVVRQVPGDLWRMLPRVAAGQTIGESMALVLRLGLVAIENGPPGFEVKHAPHVDHDGRRTGLGRVATPDVITLLDRVDADIVTELGTLIAIHENGAPSGK